MEELAKLLKRKGSIESSELEEAFLDVDRKDFVSEDLLTSAYQNTSLPIGESQTISQPQVVAFMLEKLSVSSGDKVLDVGFGSGWTTALLSHLVEEKGMVVGVELNEKIYSFGSENIKKYPELSKRIKLICGDGRKGFKPEAPYDRILVSAALEKGENIPKELVNQLKKGGRLVIPKGSSIYACKKGEEFKCGKYFGYSFVPLV